MGNYGKNKPMNNAIFLSASVPDVRREPNFAANSDSVAIASAVSALLFVALGRRPIVWGGHPAITPMIKEMCKSLEINYQAWVRMYQSKFFADSFPEDNEAFSNIRLTEKFETKDESLSAMRNLMLTENRYSSAVFIGGMSGILDESKLFSELNPDTPILPIYSTGGACRSIETNIDGFQKEVKENMDYIYLFHKYLVIEESEPRRDCPVE